MNRGAHVRAMGPSATRSPPARGTGEGAAGALGILSAHPNANARGGPSIRKWVGPEVKEAEVLDVFLSASHLPAVACAPRWKTRAHLLFHPVTMFPVARALHSTAGAPIGEIFTFLSGLYFRGKLAYAEAFARPPQGLNSGVLVITPNRGLLAHR